MKNKHTPGPWRVNDLSSNLGGEWPFGAEICRSTDGNTGPAVTAIAHGLSLAEADANSRLIAAAPELLSALEDAAFLLHKLGTNWKEAVSMKDSCLRSSNDALAAIAKAKGGAK